MLNKISGETCVSVFSSQVIQPHQQTVPSDGCVIVVHKLKIGKILRFLPKLRILSLSKLKIRQPKLKMLPWIVIGLLLVVYCWLIG